jgi:putative ABC transport system permease protein
MLHLRFVFRQIKGAEKQAVIFMFCVALSLLTLVALGSFSTSVRRSMLQDARQLHAADIIIHSHYPIAAPLRTAIKSLIDQGQASGALVYEFYSMAGFPEQDKSLLSHLKIVEKGYPFYGRVELASGRDFPSVLKPGAIIVERKALDGLGAEIGDRLRIGDAVLTIADVVTAEPDRPVSFFSFGPRIFIAAADLDRLDLIGKGSRIQYNYLLQVSDHTRIDSLAKELADVAIPRQERVSTFQTAQSGVKRFFENFLFFLNLIGIFTLLLAGIGIQTALQALLKDSEQTIAIMKSLGATSRFIANHFAAMIIMIGMAGTVLGLIASLLLQLYFPRLFAGILPAGVTLVIAWDVVLRGLLLGAFVVVLFSLLPLHRIRNLKPAFIFRKESAAAPKQFSYYGNLAIIVLFFIGLVVWQLDDVKIGLYFVLGLAGLVGLTAGFTQGILLALKKRPPRSLALRQASRGLFRPNNATRAIIITLTGSLAVIFSIYLVEENLQATFVQSYPENLPNAYFLDIQPEQKNEFTDILGKQPQFYPVIRGRLASINNRPVTPSPEETRGRDSLTREFNLTYRNSLLEDERLVSGTSLYANKDVGPLPAGEVAVSVLDTVADLGDIKVGDLLEFTIQGIPLQARVTSMRARTESKVRPFFYFTFEEKTLKDAPQTLFSAVRMKREQLAAVQNRLAALLPNISVIDIGKTVEVLSGIMRKLTSIIQFFTTFSILAGLLIIVSSIFATRLARIREAVYFKILGADTFFVLRVFTYENLVIALICALLAGLISHLGSWIICRQVLDIPCHPLPGATFGMAVVTVLLVVGVGLIASFGVIHRKPVAFLRDEGQE